MKSIYFVINDFEEFNFSDLIKKHLNKVSIAVGQLLPSNPENYDLVILWNYKKIIQNTNNFKNVILFHSSDLPHGKGWAPIYNTIIEKQEYYTITGLLMAEEVDAGNIIVKAKFKMKPEYTAFFLRKWDEEIDIILIKMILEKFDNFELIGKPQHGVSTFRKRRYKIDNEIDINLRMIELVDHLRATENRSPSFFKYNNIKFIVKIEPENIPEFPVDLEIIF